MTTPSCPKCGHVHTPADVYAVGRFTQNGPAVYRFANAPADLYTSREAAETALCARRTKTNQPGGDQ